MSNKKITFSLDADTYQDVESIAKRQGKLRTAVVRTAVKNELTRDRIHSTDARQTVMKLQRNIEKMYRKKKDGVEIGLKEIEALRKEAEKICDRLL